MTENEIFLPMPLEHSRNIFGQFDKYAKKLPATAKLLNLKLN